MIEGKIEALKQDRIDLLNSLIDLKTAISELPKDTLKDRKEFYHHWGWVNKTTQGLASMISFIGNKKIIFSD